MPIHPLFAQMPGQLTQPETLVWFIFSTIAFLAICGGILRWNANIASKMIAVGILVAVLSVGYGGFLFPATIIVVSSGLMKIAVILVLGGVACSVLPALTGSPSTDTTKPKEPVNEP
jgi:hypothetical protein